MTIKRFLLQIAPVSLFFVSSAFAQQGMGMGEALGWALSHW